MARGGEGTVVGIQGVAPCVFEKILRRIGMKSTELSEQVFEKSLAGLTKIILKGEPFSDGWQFVEDGGLRFAGT